jgi:predicted RNA-binding Zn-ribbon protein involved in translation (DUF1610 family)
MDYEKANCPECGEGIAGHELEWDNGIGRSSRLDYPLCRSCGEEIDVSDIEWISREGPYIHRCPSCSGVLGTTPPVSEGVMVYYCPGCNVVLGIEGN